MKEAAKRAAAAIAACDAILVGAGAGMGVDSGLPDFRGGEGFWRAYPPLAALGIAFEEMANPRWFRDDPELAWGFYGHRLNLYRATTPHAGFDILLGWASRKPGGAFVYTSNVDGQFHKAGFDPERIVECHGSIHHLQCLNRHCESGIWSVDACLLQVDETTLHALPPLPRCPLCGGLARPNVLMFKDPYWRSERSSEQEQRQRDWETGLKGRLGVIECGAGRAIPTVRYHCEEFRRRHGATLIRINPRESDGPLGTISLSCGAATALEAIQAELG